MTDRLVVPVIYGSVRTQRQGIKAARYILKELGRRGCESMLVDPMETKLPLLDKMYKEFEPGTVPPELEKIAGLYKRADGFAIVSGEYNQTIPPALSNTLDYFLEEGFWRPSAIVSYSAGRFGGVRAAVHLRTMLGELGMPSIPTYMSIPQIDGAFSDEGIPTDPQFTKRNDNFFREFVWYMEALKEKRKSGVPY
ncbi:MAG: NADPH-dependent FMN reductase [Candidatus Baltobacteraceae bacterium]